MLEDAIHEINNHNASGLSFEELYRQALSLFSQAKSLSGCAMLTNHHPTPKVGLNAFVTLLKIMPASVTGLQAVR